MKRIMAVTGAALLLAGCGQNDSMDMGGPGESQYGSDSSTTTEPAAPSTGVDTGTNGTGASGNGSGGTVSNMDTNQAAGAPATTESGTEADNPANTDARQDYSPADTNQVNSATEPQRSDNPQ